MFRRCEFCIRTSHHPNLANQSDIPDFNQENTVTYILDKIFYFFGESEIRISLPAH